jgi:hypothetical protein
MDSCFALEEFTAMMTDKRAQLLRMARSAESAERYEDMCAFMRALVLDGQPAILDVEERNLLSVAYKFVIGTRRASLRTLDSERVDEAENKSHEVLNGEYKKQIEMELIKVCSDALDLLNKLIQDNSEPNEARIFYLKMTADYYRYLAESVKTDPQYSEKTLEYYTMAQELAEEKLDATHPIRLGLVLNFSVCYYEILNERNKACELAKAAFDSAISQLDTLQEAQYKDSTLIMQLLRDNLTLWTSNEDNEAE